MTLPTSVGNSYTNTNNVSPTVYNPYSNSKQSVNTSASFNKKFINARKARSPLHGGNITPDLINERDLSLTP
jgi:hypothetical protein